MSENKKLIDYISLAQATYGCTDLKKAAEKIFMAGKIVVGAESGYIAFFSETGKNYDTFFIDDSYTSGQTAKTPPPISDLLKAKCYSLKGPVFHNNYNGVENNNCLPTGYPSPVNILFSPVINENEKLGILVLMNKDGGFNSEDADKAAIFTNIAAITFNSIKSRENLLKSGKKYRTLFNNLPLGIYVKNSEGMIVEMNNKMLELLNIEKKEDFVSEDILKHYIDRENRIEWERQIEQTGRIQYLESRFQTDSGEEIWISENANLLEGSDGQQYCEFSIEDITTRKNSEEAFSKTYLKLDRAHKELNEKAKWMELLNNFLIETAVSNDEKSLNNLILKKIKSCFKSGFVGIGKLNEKNDEITILSDDDKDDNPRTISITREDIGIINSESHNLIVIDSQERKLNKKTAFTEYLNFIANDGKNEIILVPINHEGKVLGNIIIVLDNEHITENQKYFLESMAEFVSVLTVNSNLYKQLEDSYQKLSQAQKTIKQQERIKAMGQIASGITHDINNMLSPITLYTEALIETEVGLSERALRYIKTIQNAVADIENVTQRLRAFYKQNEEVSLEEIRISELIDEVIDLTRPKWKNIPNKNGISIIIEKNIEDENAVLPGIKSDIREALVNCVFNSVDAMPDGGKISLSSSSSEENIMITIEDNGIGMDEEQISHCIEPFFTTKGAAGTGLGLAEVYGMLQRHGGDISIKSTLGSGTSITMLFNRTGKMSISTGCDNEVVGTSAGRNRMRILCVDDDQRILDGLNEMFSIDGHNMKSAGNGIDALKILKEMIMYKEPPDVIITDLGMPGMDGYELVKEIKKIDSLIPVVMLSGWGNQINSQEYRSEGIYCVLSKPPRIKVLRDILEKISKGST